MGNNYSVVFSALVLVWAWFIGSVGTLSNNHPYQPPVYAFDSVSRGYLTYYVIENVFDSARVTFTVGELTVRQGQERHRIMLQQDSLSFTNLMQGTAGNGRDNALATVLRSQTFTVPTSASTLEFFRVVEARSTCSPKSGSSGQPRSVWDEADLPRSALDRHFSVGKNRILDDTHLVLEIVDAANGTVLTTLDSVAVTNRPNSRFANVAGSDPTTVYRTVPLPASCRGRAVYLRWVPYRYGPTPFGCTALLFRNAVNLSAFYAYLPEGHLWWLRGDSRYDILDSAFWQQATSFYDALMATKGCVEVHEAPSYFPSAFHDSLFSVRYYDRVDTVRGIPQNLRIRTKPCFGASARTPSVSPNTDSPVAGFLRGAVIERGADHVVLRVCGNQPLGTISIRLVAVGAADVALTASIVAVGALLDVVLPTTSLPSGAFVASVVSSNGERCSIPLHIAR